MTTNNIFIGPSNNSSDITSMYDVHTMDMIKQVDGAEFYDLKSKFFNYLSSERSKLNEENEQIEQSDNDTIPEQKKKQSTETLPWYSIITIIIFIILILLCIVYRESLRSLSNLATLDPRKFRS